MPSPRSWTAAFEILDAEIGAALRAAAPRYEIMPSTSVPIIVSSRDSRRPVIVEAHWGLVSAWMKRPKPLMKSFNAPIEDAPSKPKWRNAWRRQRCLIPASYWYQAQKLRGASVLCAASSDPGEGLMFAGLWSYWLDSNLEPIRPTCAILTGPAARNIRHIHARMPIVLQPEGWIQWLDPEVREHHAVSQILKRSAAHSVDLVSASI